MQVYDIRTLRELSTFRGHGRDVVSAAWHPIHEDVFASGGHDGGLMLWIMGYTDPQCEISGAHEGPIWSLAYHPVGHLLATGEL